MRSFSPHIQRRGRYRSQQIGQNKQWTLGSTLDLPSAEHGASRVPPNKSWIEMEEERRGYTTTQCHRAIRRFPTINHVVSKYIGIGQKHEREDTHCLRTATTETHHHRAPQNQITVFWPMHQVGSQQNYRTISSKPSLQSNSATNIRGHQYHIICSLPKCPPFSILNHRGISPSSRRQTPSSPPQTRRNTAHRRPSPTRHSLSCPLPLPRPQTQCQQNCGTDWLRPPHSAAASSLSVAARS